MRAEQLDRKYSKMVASSSLSMEFMSLLPFTVQYSGSVFVVGFVFGVIRNIWTNEQLGEDIAIMYEIPLILVASWWLWWYIVRGMEALSVTICEGDVCRREKRTITLQDAIMTGCISFFYLMMYEFVLAKIWEKDTLSSFVVKQCTYPKTVGLVGQIGFGCIPVLQYLLNKSPSTKSKQI